MPHCKEADWKLFKEKIIVWQRNYIEKQNQKLIKILSDEKLSPEERFWEAEKLIFSEKKKAGVSVELSRSKFKFNIMQLLNTKVITLNDLSDFSGELQEEIKRYLED